MIVSLMRVRRLTSATVRPARPRASASVSPTRTPRLHCSTVLHAAPQAGCRRHDRIITAMPAAELPKAAGGIRDPGLLADHGHAQLAVGIGDELAGQVDGDGMEVAGEREWGGVV